LRALVLETHNIERLLRHLGEPLEPPKRSPARDPPYFKSQVLRRKLGELNGWVIDAALTHRLFGLEQAEVRAVAHVRSYFNVFAPGSFANHGLGIALAFNVGSTAHPGCNNSSANPNHPPVLCLRVNHPPVRFAYA
jgi:hypothetical protein